MTTTHSREFGVKTPGRSAIEISSRVGEVVAEAGISSGLCNVFVHHTSASLMICENADPAVMADLETFMQRLVPDGDPAFTHIDEGPDDMPSHVRSILTQSDLNIPVTSGRCVLGTWQGIYLWEHRLAPHTRKILITVNGE